MIQQWEMWCPCKGNRWQMILSPLPTSDAMASASGQGEFLKKRSVNLFQLKRNKIGSQLDSLRLTNIATSPWGRSSSTHQTAQFTCSHRHPGSHRSSAQCSRWIHGWTAARKPSGRSGQRWFCGNTAGSSWSPLGWRGRFAAHTASHRRGLLWDHLQGDGRMRRH